jgi:hypothetical protein
MGIQGTNIIITLFQVGKNAHLKFFLKTIELRHITHCRKPNT